MLNCLCELMWALKRFHFNIKNLQLMRHNSPVASFNSHDGRRAAHSPHRIQPDLNQSIREPRGVTPMGKLVKVTVHPSVLHQTVQTVMPVQTQSH